MIYEFLNPSDSHTFVAKNREVATLTVFILGTCYGAKQKEGDEDIPIFLFGGSEAWYKKTFGRDVEEGLFELKDDIADSLDSFVIGDYVDRGIFERAISMIENPVSRKEFKAERMADAGMLQRHDPIFQSYGYTLTDVGVEAYHKAYPPEPLPPPVKAWGDRPPKTLKGRIGFIKRQCTKPLEEAYWLEVEGEKNVEIWTLSESALDKKMEAFGYDEFEGSDRIHYGIEESEAMPTCEVTGELLNGIWSGDPEFIGYGLEGFSWRRSLRFQMEERDWQEAHGFIERLDAEDQEQAKLIRLIVDSCFLEPEKLNDTGLICPGGGCYTEFSELIELFDFMKTDS
jgi:hypothetical protein